MMRLRSDIAARFFRLNRRSKKKCTLLMLLGLCLLGFLHFVLLPKASGGYNEACHVPKERLDALRHLAKQTILALEKMNETYWIDHGTLIGAVRLQDILPHDHDVDISRLHANSNLDLGNTFRELLLPHNIKGNLMITYMDYNNDKSRVTCDMFRYDVIARNISRSRSIKYLKEYWPSSIKQGFIGALKNTISEQVLPMDLFLPTTRIPFLGMMVRAPGNFREVIRRRYPYTWFMQFPYKWKCWIPFM